MNQSTVLRRCIACKKLIDRQELFRVIRDYRDGVVLDKGMGRSAYLCQSEDCLDEACRRKRFHRALRCEVPISVIEILRNRLNHCNDSLTEAR